MKNILIIIYIFIIIASCNNNSDTYNLYPDNTNYEHYPLEDGLMKVVWFFPDTKDTSVIYFWNTDKKIKDSTAYYFDRQGYKTEEIIYEDNMNTKTRKIFYKNGNVHWEFTVKGKKKDRDIKSYYSSGELKYIKEVIVYKDSIDFLNNIRYYNRNGELNIDSTRYVEMLCPKDTMKISDSLKIEFNVIKPDYIGGYAVVGSIEKYFNAEYIDYDDIIKGKVYCYKPKHIGINFIEVVFVLKILGTDMQYNTFLKKEIYVTEG